jgi:hypothetical protein
MSATLESRPVEQAVPAALPPAPRRTVGKLFAMVILGFFTFAILVPSFLGCGGEISRESGVRANVSTVAMALEQYASDHDGQYPRADHWVEDLTREHRNYLPGNKLPRSPWATQAQTAALTPAGTGLPTASQLGDRAKTAIRGAVVGKGEAPRTAPTSAYQYGAILYDLDPKTQTYVLYGVGQKHKRAEVVVAL